jgi:hypothetical protein
MNRFGPLVCDGQLGGHHVIASTRRSRGSVKPVSREADGAKRSGLTEPWTARQSRVVMAAVRVTAAYVRERSGRSRRASGREAGGRRSSAAAVQDSEADARSLYERKFRAKPVRDCEASVKRHPGRGRIMRRTPQLQETRAVRPDERDIGMGRERPTPTGPWGEEGGMAEGVAHAPLVSDSDIDGGTDADPGGTERRPVRPREVQHRQRVPDRASHLRSAPTCLLRRAQCKRSWGNGAPGFAFPPLSLRFLGLGRNPEEGGAGHLSELTGGLRLVRATTERCVGLPFDLARHNLLNRQDARIHDRPNAPSPGTASAGGAR